MDDVSRRFHGAEDPFRRAAQAPAPSRARPSKAGVAPPVLRGLAAFVRRRWFLAYLSGLAAFGVVHDVGPVWLAIVLGLGVAGVLFWMSFKVLTVLEAAGHAVARDLAGCSWWVPGTRLLLLGGAGWLLAQLLVRWGSDALDEIMQATGDHARKIAGFAKVVAGVSRFTPWPHLEGVLQLSFFILFIGS